jgi:ribosomal protein S3
MAQKVNPISLRLQQTNRNFESCWYSDFFYTSLINQDLQIQQYLDSILKQIEYPSGRYVVHNLPKKSKISVFFCNPKTSRLKRTQRFHLQYTKKKNKAIYKKSYFIKNGVALNKQYYYLLNEMGFYSTKLQKNQGLLNNKHSLNIDNGLKSISLFSRDINKSFKRLNTISTNSAVISREHLNCESLWKTRFSDIKMQSNFQDEISSKYAKIVIANCEKILKNKINTYTTTGIYLFLHKKQFFFRFICAIFFLLKQQNPSILLHYATIFQKLSGLYSLTLPLLINKKKQLNCLTEKVETKITPQLINLPLTQVVDSAFGGFSKENRNTNLPIKTKHTTVFTKKKHLSAFKKMTDFFFSNKNMFGNNKMVASLYGNKKQLSNISCKKPYKEHLQVVLSNQLQRSINLQFFRAFNDLQSALFLAQEIVYYLERRINFRRIKNQILNEIKKKTHIQGIRISCSGRVGGRSKKAQRSKTETFKYGQTSLHVFSSKIDFACKSARTAFGLIGVKVWICFK